MILPSMRATSSGSRLGLPLPAALRSASRLAMMLVSPDRFTSGVARAARKRVCTAWKKLQAHHMYQAPFSGTDVGCFFVCIAHYGWQAGHDAGQP